MIKDALVSFWNSPDSTDRAHFVGSGFFLAPAKVLTAKHVIQGGGGLWLRPEAGATGFSVLRPGGRLVIYGATAGNPPAGLEMAKLFFRQVRIIGSTMGSPAEFAAMLRFVATHRIEPALDQVFALDEAVAAHQRLLAAEQMGKIVLRHG